MSAEPFLLAFAAAWIHGASNVFLGQQKEPEAAVAMMLAVGVLAFVPVTVFDWHVHAAAIPFIVASALLELGYFAFLAAAYRISEVSLVYPVARGAAPVLVLVIAVAVLGHGTSIGQVSGVVAVGVGIVLVRGRAASLTAGDARGFALALVTAAFIAGYTLVDKEGLKHASPIPFIELVLVGPAVLYAIAIGRTRGVDALRSELTLKIGAIGTVLFGTYILVLLALKLAPAASVSAVRETSVVVASGLAAVVAKERVGPARFAGAVLVAGGIALIALAT